MSSPSSQHERLVEAIQALSLARSLPRVTEIVRRAARDLTQADGATFVLREGDQCHYVDEDAIGPLWKGRRFPIGACVSGLAMTEGRAIVIPDIYKDARVPILAYQPTFVKSLFMTPVRERESIAAIGVYWAEEHVPSADEMRLLATLANSTAVAIENIELHAALARQVTELESAAAAKDQFLLTLSHELRTPMNSILGLSGLLLEEASSDTELRDGLESIHRNAETEMRLIADLLDTSQYLAGRLSLRTARLDLTRVAHVAARSARLAAERKRIKLTVNDASADGTVEGDFDRLLQVVGNLLTNAIKFTPDEGEIRVELSDEGRWVLLAVEDNGEGIEAWLLPRVFDRFQSQSTELTRRHGGLGLGLAIVKSLVEAHGGRVAARSRGVGQGARFEVYLPRAARANIALVRADLN